MSTTPNPNTERTDAPTDESSPSCGAEEMPEIMGCPLAHTVDTGEGGL
ncbi:MULTISPECIES: hypothetical protein [Halolamina]|uniref:Uncharacterized protein n=2 Tax=Halolamina TaxID=1075397 RepID=A0A1I5WCU7_9EURY|nr:MULTISPECIES: hypothetical protein [Halolamina]NHX37987.1 hypothetical protein [Halolamina sp. R1-12]SFQ17457.1 hypothetical protein SAMN05216277_12711 [Halolamina pelagica]